MTALFLFAHQDDEFGVMHAIQAGLERGERVYCVYLTNGAWRGVTSEQRNLESRRVLTGLGVPGANMVFLGSEIEIGDGELVENLERCLSALTARAAGFGTIERIIMHAWEGGHHDHDAVHLIGAALADHLGILDKTLQFPLYRMPANRLTLTFASPLAANGPVMAEHIPLAHRIRNIALLRHYKSQWRVMLKLMPHLAWDYARNGTQKFQPVSIARLHQRPYPGQLLYEMWRLYAWDRFAVHALPFIDRHFGGNVRPAEFRSGAGDHG